MITINAFWFGVLMTVVGLIVLFIILAFISVKKSEAQAGEEDVWMDEGEFKKMLNEAVREAMKQNMFGGSVEDSDDGKNI